jgi:hypothetical protein
MSPQVAKGAHESTDVCRIPLGRQTMKRVRKQALSLLAGIVFSAASMAALAEPETDARREARIHFNRAMELIDDGQVASAVVELERSYQLQPHHAVLYNLGQAYVELARPVEAVDTLQRYLREGGKAIKQDRRIEVEREIARQQSRIATVEILGASAGTTIRLDGLEIGKAPLKGPIRVGVGTHVLSALADGHDPVEMSIQVAGEDRKVVQLPQGRPTAEPTGASNAAAQPSEPRADSTVRPIQPQEQTEVSPQPVSIEPSPAPPSATEQPVPPANGGGHAMRVAGVLAGIAGGLGLVSGGILLEVSSSRSSDAAWYRQRAIDVEANRLQGEADSFNHWAIGSFVAGGALLAAGAVLYLVAPNDSSPSGAQAGLTPVVGRGCLGMAAAGTW